MVAINKIFCASLLVAAPAFAAALPEAQAQADLSKYKDKLGKLKEKFKGGKDEDCDSFTKTTLETSTTSDCDTATKTTEIITSTSSSDCDPVTKTTASSSSASSLKLKKVPHVGGVTPFLLLGYAPSLALWGGATVAAIFTFTEHWPLFQDTFYKKLPIMGKLWIKEVDPQDLPQ
ncbi:hypothetical protein KL935_000326 [Ogataea polymorpha]|nr:hypothetical protein KL935_000326 [Ogataea polymorpha]KAG7908312.1 hypothetical protein KL907_001802 [Ogataea polymorpha]KAG7908958.1 hypothetical protein KL906_003189 [Ogataea polymorpha]KAG7921077.1 hypothetical protein KL927_000321 [Ogataea polymorpha]